MFAFLFGIIIGLVLAKAFTQKPTRPQRTLMPTFEDYRVKIADTIRDLARRNEYTQESPVYNELADALEQDRFPRPASGESVPTGQTASTVPQATSYSTESMAQQSDATASLKPSVSPVKETLDNVNTMLFAGAFLIIVSVGILVSANIEAISNEVRIVLMLLLGIIFYVSGLALYRVSKFRPAGSTFTAIGLALVPLTGLAAQSLIFPESWRHPVIALTAFFSLGLSLLTYRFVRQLYVQFFSTIASLLTLQYALLSVNADYAFIVWALLIAGIIMMITVQKSRLSDFKLPFSVTAQILIPLTLLAHLNLFVEGEATWWRLGVSLGLSAVFYHAAVRLQDQRHSQELVAIIALLMWPLSVVCFVTEAFDALSVQLVLAGVSLGFSVIYAVLSRFIGSSSETAGAYRNPLITLPIGLSFFGGAVLFGEWEWLAGALLLVAGIHGWLFMRSSNTNQLTLALLSILLLPSVVLWGVVDLSADIEPFVALAYFVIGWTLIGLGALLKNNAVFTKDARSMFVSAQTLAFSAVVAVSILIDPWMQVLATSAIGVSALAWWRMYKEPLFIALSVAAFYLALGRALMSLPGLDNAVSLAWFMSATIVGVVTYALSWVGATFSAPTRQDWCIRISAIVVLAFGVFVADEWLSNLSLYIVAATLAVEAWRIKSSILTRVSVATGIVAAEYSLHLIGIGEVQAYTIPWALFAGWLAYDEHRNQKPVTRDGYVALSLGILTLPLLMQNLSEPTLGHFTLLIFESLLLIIIGTQLRYKLCLWWGLATIFIATFEQVMGVLSNIPNYVITFGAGLILLGVALKFLQSHNDE